MQDTKTHQKNKLHHLWVPPISIVPKPYRLRLSLLNDGYEEGDCPAREFVFPSLMGLTIAIQQLEEAFKEPGYSARKAGVKIPGNEGDRSDDGRWESIVIHFKPDEASESWKECIGRIHGIEKDWGLVEEKEEDDEE